MQSVLNVYIGEYEVKKSNFIAFLVPFDRFEEYNENLRKEHPKARHVVWAYRTLNEFAQVVENSSDDGEPKGTSGPPVLNVMRGSDLIECAVLIVRYFGGIKLGTGGLVRAYSSAANVAISNAELKLHELKETLNFKTSYPLVQRIEYYLNKNDISSASRDFEAGGVLWKVNFTKEEKEDFLEFIKTFVIDGEVTISE